ncbi:glycophorin-C-like [Denticeps clupeoides]|uniref:glycophorin-C-like n=1 Tax=Denticeps clupeoides TaxID=299321 RepID=UPI0010A4B1BB|nr:glycophorin-C-like [Denticeps clupeoides]
MSEATGFLNTTTGHILSVSSDYVTIIATSPTTTVLPSVSGHMTDEFFIAILGGVIAASILVTAFVLFVLFRFIFQHKGTYYTHEAKSLESADSVDAVLKSDPVLQELVDEDV